MCIRDSWCSEGAEGRGFDLAEALSSHLTLLEDRESFVRSFISTGGSIEYFVAWFSDGMNTGTVLDWELMKRLSALQVNLDLDVYGGKDTE